LTSSFTVSEQRTEGQGEILELEREIVKAVLQNDAEAIGRFLSDDWIAIDHDGSIATKSDFLNAIKSGALTHSAMEFTDSRIRTYGKFAVATGLTTSTSKYSGQEFTQRERATDVFVMNDGRWQCVLTQLSTFIAK